LRLPKNRTVAHHLSVGLGNDGHDEYRASQQAKYDEAYPKQTSGVKLCLPPR